MSDTLGIICATLVAAVAVGSPLACSVHDNYTVAEMVKAGANPIDAKCAVKGSDYTVLCIARVAQQGASK